MVDDIFVERAFVFDDDWRAILVDAERVDALARPPDCPDETA